MPPKSLNKIQKRVAKKKGTKAVLHINSRDSQKLLQAARRQDRIAQLAAARNNSTAKSVERVAFFQDALSEGTEPMDVERTHLFINNYINRHAAELATLEKERRTGRPPTKRETLLKQVRAREENEYSSGLWMPNLLDSDNVCKLSDWGGEWSSLALLKFCRVAKGGGVSESAFPPKGSN